MKKYEKFVIRGLPIDAVESEGKRIIRGLIPFNSKSEDMGGWREVIAPTAFNRSLKAVQDEGAEIFALRNHNNDIVLGNTAAGTLRLRSTETGLEAEVDLPDSPDGLNAFAAISRGDCRGLSFGFYPVKYDDVGNTRTLREVNLKEVSFGVPTPAYPETSSTAFLRSMESLQEKGINLETVMTVLSKDSKDITEDDKSSLKDFVESVRVIYEPKEPVKEPVVETVPTEPAVPKVDENLLLELEIEQTI